ncbi:MAG: hypothetical protein EPO28_17575 [Saprospiraceae bacterium]|nr:MAG: hypothetical protein EPO28_17575 [Saprospiraceae bacterium]
MNQETINILIWVSPLIVGGIIAAINANSVNDTTEKVEAWTRRTQTNVSTKSSWFYRYIVNPVLWTIVKFSDWTDSFTHRGLKNGVRVAASLYLVAAWCFIFYAALMFIVIVAIVIAILYVGFKVLLDSNEDVRRGYEKGRSIIGSGGSGTRTNPETGIIQEEGLFGYIDTDTRVNQETGVIQKKGLFGWNDTDERIDPESGKIQKEGFLGYNDTDTKVNQETGVIQKKGLLGWNDTDERIDPESGKHQKRGLLGWVDE